MMMTYLNNGSQYYFLLLICSTLFVKIISGGYTYTHDYKDALTKSILFFEGQRSGKLPPDQILKWRGDSALSDGQAAGVDLSGGYYDAGDNLKFNLPMAYTTTMLSWSVIEFGGQMGSDRASALQAIRWGADYLIKCASKVKSDNVLFAGVGDPYVDHACWERPEVMDGGRAVYSVTAGSDLAGEVAAALAAASIVFRNVDLGYSVTLLNNADIVMKFAINNKAKYSDAKINACPYYCSSGYQDELLWGAAWMFKATKSVDYRNYVMSFENGDTSFFSWDSKFPGANVLLAGEYLVGNDKDFEKFVVKAETFMCKIMNYPSTGATYTQGGLMILLPDSPLEYVTSISFLIAVYAKYMSQTNHVFQCGTYSFNSVQLQNQAKAQVDYILGTNPKAMSYMVGYGSNYPMRIHHRGSSLPSTISGCAEGSPYLNTPSPNPNILIGAVVGGPKRDDSFDDDRSSYSQSEPATYINAPLVGILASLLH